MNYIDITENKKTHSIKNRIINIINREGIQGPKGQDGVTPHIDEESGHWMIGDVDTNVDARGKPGSTPYLDDEFYWCIDGVRIGAKATRSIDDEAVCAIPHIDNENFHWMIGGKDTGVSALGLKGDPGLTPRIENGRWYIGDTDTGVEAGLKKKISLK